MFYRLLYTVTPVACYKIPQVSLLHFFRLWCTKDKFTKGQSHTHTLSLSSSHPFFLSHSTLISVEFNGETVVNNTDDTGVKNSVTLIKNSRALSVHATTPGRFSLPLKESSLCIWYYIGTALARERATDFD